MIISLRGTNGSGKSFVVRNLRALARAERLHYGCLGAKKPEAHALTLPQVAEPVYLLGPYDLIRSGGCDSVQPYEIIPELIAKYAERGHVLFEGIIVTSVYGRVGALLEQWGKDVVFLFLDTTLDQCLARVEDRRGRGRDERLIKNVTMKFLSSQAVRRRVLEEGKMRVEEANSATGHLVIHELLRFAP